MTLNDFVKKYNGEKVDFDNAYGCQCVDLFRQYCHDVLEIPHTGSVDGAKDLYLNYDKLEKEKKYFCIIKHTGTTEYMKGDIAVWNGTSDNKHGHVAIVLAELNSDIIVFEQNGIRQDGAKIVLRSKDNMLGVLRFM